MPPNQDPKKKMRELRRRAELVLEKKLQEPFNIPALSTKDVEKLIHELQVHQIELEIQNEELRQAQVASEQSRDKYADLYDFAPVGYVTLNGQGTILEANLTAAKLLDTHRRDLIKQRFSRFLNEREADNYYFYLTKLFDSEKRQACETRLQKKDGGLIDIRLEGIAVQGSKGEHKQCRLTISDITDRKAAELAIQSHRDLLAAIFEISPNVIMVVNREGRVEEINRAGVNFNGREKEEILGLLGGEVFRCLNSFDGLGCGRNPECPKCPVRTNVMKTFATGESVFESEGQLNVRRNSSELTIHILISTALVKVGKEERVVVTISDFTERKKMEEQLRKSERQLAHDLEAMTRLQEIGRLFISDGDKALALAKILDAAIDFTGADCGNVQLLDQKNGCLKIVTQRGFDKTFLDFWDRVHAGSGACGTALLSGERVMVEDVTQSPLFIDTPALEVELAAGIRAVQSTPLVSRSGKMLGIISTHWATPYRPDEASLRLLDLLVRQASDIVERAEREEALTESEERFRVVFESATECIFVKNTDLEYTHVNPAVTRLFDLPASEIVGKHAEDLYGEELGEQISAINRRVLAGETLEQEQVRVIRGAPLKFHDLRVPLRDAENNIIGVCCLSRYTAEVVSEDRTLGRVAEQYPSRAMQETLNLARAAARSRGMVLLLGESGSGKDFLARWIHDHSSQQSGPFLSVNCAALPKELAESELFGHERGAFTGAAIRKKGQLELAEGGTVLLNEIGELDLPVQAKLLSFLDTSSFLRVGGEKSVKVGCRLLAATHRNLEQEVSEGRFLAPLFYRLSVFPIEVPPLRERLQDLPILVKEIVRRVALHTQLEDLPVIDEKHLNLLSRYHWPGNVRELRNILERSLILWQGGNLKLALDTRNNLAGSPGIYVTYRAGKPLREFHQEVNKYLCEEALSHCNGNKSEAAELLGISRDAFYRYLKKLGLMS